MKDMKLIMEGWRKYSAEINENSDIGVVYLFENKKPVKTEFNVLLENYDNGDLTADQLIETWEKSFDYELSLLEEGILDKINDWIHTKSVQLWQLLQRGKEAGLKAVQSYANMAAKFKEKHPAISRAATIVALSAAMFMVMAAFDSPEAAAKIANGERVFNDTYINMLKNATIEVARATAEGGDLGDKAEAMRWAMDAVEVINNAADSSTIEQVTQFKDRSGILIKHGHGYIEDLIATVRDANLPLEERQSAAKILKTLEKAQTEFRKNY